VDVEDERRLGDSEPNVCCVNSRRV
jgi:hypothetical protein